MSGFDIKKIFAFFPPKPVGVTGLSFCERATALEPHVKHIRKSVDGLFPRGEDNAITLCATAATRDLSPIASLFDLEKIQSKSTVAERICQQCLHTARDILDTVKV